MTHQRVDTSRPLTEDQVRRILTRAVELDAGDTGLTAADVRRIGAEAHISSHAIERALAETDFVTHTQPAMAEVRTPRWKRLVRRFGLFAAGALFGAVTLASEGGGFAREATLILCGATALFTLVRGLYHRGKGRLVALQKELGLLMVGAIVSLGLLHGLETAQAVALWWFILAIAGTGIVRLNVRNKEAPTA